MDAELRNLSLKKRARSYSGNTTNALIADMAGLLPPDFEPADLAGVIPFRSGFIRNAKRLGDVSKVLPFEKSANISEEMVTAIENALKKRNLYMRPDDSGFRTFYPYVQKYRALVGKKLDEDLISPLTGRVLGRAGQVIDDDLENLIVDRGIEWVKSGGKKAYVTRTYTPRETMQELRDQLPVDVVREILEEVGLLK